jgi:hypothetical protein
MVSVPVLQFAMEEAEVGRGGYDSLLLDLYGSGLAVIGNYQSIGHFYRIYHAESLWTHNYKGVGSQSSNECISYR